MGVKCSSLSTRGAQEDAQRSGDFTCRVCKVRSRPADAVPKTSASIIQRKERKQKSLKRPLRILQWNAEGINTKMSELRPFLEEYKIDIALIQESKLTKEKDPETPDIRGYNDYRGDRKGVKYAGGGLLIYIKDDIVFNA